jgi:hypothetical protein
VVLDMVFQLTLARRRLYQSLREAGDSPDTANLRLLSIIRWWSVRSTAGWLAIGHLALLVRSLLPETSSPELTWWSTGVFTLGLIMGTTSAMRLVTLSRNDELQAFLQTERSSADMIDGPIHQGR